MKILIVHVHVKTECIEAFKEATLKNANASIAEPGVARFDFLQDESAPTHFVLYEVYRDESGPVNHKLTPHYKAWRDHVDPMMAEPRKGVWFDNLFPTDEGFYPHRRQQDLGREARKS